MKTEKLYDKDSHIKDFTAKVLDCRKNDGKYEIILDRTAFFPEGGGQPADTGKIGNNTISDVQIIDGEIVHYLDGAIEIGTTVNCSLNWDQRFRRMQSHSGEHIVSGIVHRLYGFDNVGFHMGEDVTIDFNGELTRDQILNIEKLANEAIYKNVEFICEYPDEETLKDLDYRSKLELTENVRIVTIKDYDVCACCAPHVYSSGEIGIIKILDFNRHRGGVRIHMLCGADAVEDYEKKYENLRQISAELCSKQNETAAAFEKLMNDHGQLKAEIAALKIEITSLKSSAIADTDSCVLIFEKEIQMNDLRKLVLSGAEKTDKLCAGFVGDDEKGYRFAIASKCIDLTKKAKDITAALNGKGGGSAELLQGNASITRKEIELYFKENY